MHVRLANYQISDPHKGFKIAWSKLLDVRDIRGIEKTILRHCHFNEIIHTGEWINSSVDDIVEIIEMYLTE